ncbi:capsule biosynthesis GfcC family protein [Photobacterium alginatilyticum]|uniref:capsule biosynthesis GfcC family protein n=1 Tax=Photobacterium alginatilyticum TaxID=1775171 RepID=UPI0040687FEB
MKLLGSTSQLIKILLVSLPAFASPAFADTQAVSSQTLSTQSTHVVLKSTANSSVQITLDYDSPVRLEQLLRDSQGYINKQGDINAEFLSPPDIYWTGASLINTQQTLNKSGIINALENERAIWANQQDTARASALSALTQWIENNIENLRLHLALDYDAILINPSLNPVVTGRFTLILPSRPKHVLVLGATSEPNLVEWQERKQANDYLDEVQILESAANSYAWVIQPDGVVEKHPIAYWNQNHMDIAPGATIYLGYKSFLNSNKDLNQEIVKLLKNRVL